MQSTYARLSQVTPRWDTDRVLFEIDDGERRSPCSISREALESAGEGYKARPWQLLEAFERLWPGIEQIALAKIRATASKPAGITPISLDELNDPPPTVPAAAALHRSHAA
jgi:Protein of unknown function (DUF1488)